MKDRFSNLPSPALFVAMLAVVLAVGGLAEALPGRKTVDRNDIKKNAVKTKSIKKGAVTAAKIRDAAVTAAKIAADAVTTAAIANDAVTTAKLDGSAVTTAKLDGSAVTTPKIANVAVSRAKIANDAIGSPQVEADSLTAGDLAPGVLSVVAYGRVSNPNPGAPALAPGAVGLTGVTGGPDGLGRTTVTVDAGVLPGGNVSTCSVQATPAATAVADDGTSLGFDTVTVGTGPPAPATAVQAQTRGSGEALNDFDYFVQVTCPGV